MEKKIAELFKGFFGRLPERMEELPASGSARKYYRLYSGEESYMGTWNQDVEENALFLEFSRHFLDKGLHVPAIYAVSSDKLTYIQEDLGNRTLLEVVQEERRESRLNGHLTDLYKKTLDELLRFQILGHEGMDYSRCVPRPVFDRRCILWDLNYFKYCFLRLAGIAFSEELLENDFERLTVSLCGVDAEAFMFRDFQSRNVMVRDEEVWFIDYQGGRRGALQYDVASLLYDAIVEIPDEQREELLEYYMEGLRRYRPVDEQQFRRDYYHFVLIRLLQAMGAFGLRGLYERKQHFLDSIRPGIQIIAGLFEHESLEDTYPELHRIVYRLQKRF